jgi:hypothetical protein
MALECLLCVFLNSEKDLINKDGFKYENKNYNFYHHLDTILSISYSECSDSYRQLFFWNISMSRIILIAITALIGFLLGFIAAGMKRKSL